MDHWFQKFSEPAYAILRIVIGLLFAFHGAQKLFGAFGGVSRLSDPLMLAAGLIELLGGGLVALGLATRVAAFLASGQMAVAYFKVHAPAGFWPIMNRGELAVVYCFIFLYIAARGPGGFSLDALIRTRKRRDSSG